MATNSKKTPTAAAAGKLTLRLSHHGMRSKGVRGPSLPTIRTGKINEAFKKLYLAYKKAPDAEKRTAFVRAVDYIRDNDLSRDTVRATLETLDYSPNGVQQKTFRLFTLLRPEKVPVLDALRENKISLIAAFRGTADVRSSDERIGDALFEAAAAIYNQGASLKDYLDLAKQSWAFAKSQLPPPELHQGNGSAGKPAKAVSSIAPPPAADAQDQDADELEQDAVA